MSWFSHKNHDFPVHFLCQSLASLLLFASLSLSLSLLPAMQIISIVQLGRESLEVRREGNSVFHEFSTGSQTSAGPGILVS